MFGTKLHFLFSYDLDTLYVLIIRRVLHLFIQCQCACSLKAYGFNTCFFENV